MPRSKGSELASPFLEKALRLLPYITIGHRFDSHTRIDNVLRKPGFRYGLSENAIARSPTMYSVYGTRTRRHIT